MDAPRIRAKQTLFSHNSEGKTCSDIPRLVRPTSPTSARESGKQLSAYKTSRRRGNPRAQPSPLLQPERYNITGTLLNPGGGLGELKVSVRARARQIKIKCQVVAGTAQTQSERHVLFAARECVQKISCHLSVVAAPGRLSLPNGLTRVSSGGRFQSKGTTRDGDSGTNGSSGRARSYFENTSCYPLG